MRPARLSASISAGRRGCSSKLDRINQKYGRGTLYPAAMGVVRGWQLKAEHQSSRYTTRLGELPRVRA